MADHGVAGVVVVGVLAMLGATAAAAAPARPVVALKAVPFPLEDVRLLDGPFKKAMELDGAYLLRLEPDRLLSRFRENAGLEPKAKIYGGWENAGVAGHTLGHYLSACSLMYASTGDERFRKRADAIVDELKACQDAGGDGYVAGIPDGRRIFKEVAAGDIRSKGFDLNGCWVPLYTLHKLFAGLRDAYHHCGSRMALGVEVKLADWLEKTLSGLSEAQMQKVLACEHGGMNEVLADLYADTGEARYLALSRRFHHKAVLDPLANREDRLRGLHGNTQIPKLVGLARRYELTGDEADRTAAEFFWDRVVHHHSYAIGGHSDGEHFGAPDKLNDRLGQNTCETCNTYNMLKLTRHVFAWTASVDAADYYERALYNHILASQNPADGMVCYYVTLKPGSHKSYSTPFDSFWCCVGTGIENHARYGEAIYFHDSDGLYVNLFIPSVLTWKDKGLVLRQETGYPETDTTCLTLECAKPLPLTLRIRCPGWAKDAVRVAVNGTPLKTGAAPGSYVEVARTWKRGDRVEVTIPRRLRVETMPDNPGRVAVLYGPLVLAGELGPVDDPAAASADYVPVFLTGGKALADWLEPVEGRSSTFRTAGVGKPRDVTFSPFYRMHGKRYSVYWDLFTPAQWQQREAAYKAEQERLKRLEAMTVDFVQPGEMQPERDHHMQGEKTGAGEAFGRKWRHAVDGGWFAFDLKVLPDAPVVLLVTYWGSDSGSRTFDVLVDGTKIATQSLRSNRPGTFYDETHRIPEELTRGKQKVTVRFQGHPGNTAGGVFGLRVIRGDVAQP